MISFLGLLYCVKILSDEEERRSGRRGARHMHAQSVSIKISIMTFDTI